MPALEPGEARLYWVDIDGRAIHRYDPESGEDEVRAMTGRPTALALTDTPGRLLVALERGLAFFDWERSETREWLPLEPIREPAQRWSMRSGRAVLGRLDVRPRRSRSFAGLAVPGVPRRHGRDGAHRGGRVERLASRLTVAPCISPIPRGSRSGRSTTTRIPATPPTSASSLDFTSLPGRPDGACVDADGCYWIACVFGWAVLRVTPEGKVDRQISLPVEKPTMPAFGGADLAERRHHVDRRRGDPRGRPGAAGGGRAVRGRVGVRGLPEPHFGASASGAPAR